MELEYLLKAARRHWIIVVVVAALGLVLGSVLRPTPDPIYESSASILVAPTNFNEVGRAPASERFIMSEMVVMQSAGMAQRAVGLSGLDLSIAEAVEAVTVENLPGTDVVMVTAEATEPADAQALANGFVDAYIEGLETQVANGNRDAEIALVEVSIERVEAQLRTVEEQISELLGPFVFPGDGVATADRAPVPALEQIAPSLATDREILGGQYSELIRRRTELEFANSPMVGSRVVQRAQLPVVPVEASSPIITVAIPLASLLAGLLAATVVARSSKKVLDESEVVDILGVPIAVRVDRLRGVARALVDEPGSLSQLLREPVDQLVVQAEANLVEGRALTLVVTRHQRKVGATTMATALAHRYAEMGAKVLLIDADLEHPELSELFEADGDGLRSLMNQSRPAQQRSTKDRLTRELFAGSGHPNLLVVGSGGRADSNEVGGRDVRQMIERASAVADVVIFDTGPLLGSVMAAKLVHTADVTVVMLPLRRQQRRPLGLVARYLQQSNGTVLPVLSPDLRSLRSPRRKVDAGRPMADEPGSIPVTDDRLDHSARRKEVHRSTSTSQQTVADSSLQLKLKPEGGRGDGDFTEVADREV